MSDLRDLPSPSICYRDLMVASRRKLFSAKGWIFELQHEGVRCLITKYGDVVRLESRSGRDMSACFPARRPFRIRPAGIVAKRADSPYSAGRSDAWQKVKTTAGEGRERDRRSGR